MVPKTPVEFFGPIAGWANEFLKWANDVEACYGSKCQPTREQLRDLDVLRGEFRNMALHAKSWADIVEDCYCHNCNVNCKDKGHTKPPTSPF